MQSGALGSSPGSLLVVAGAVAAAGAVLFAVANLLMRAFGDDINSYARDTDHYREMSTTAQLSAFYSSARNIPVMMGFLGILLFLGGVLTAIGAGVWFLRMRV